MSSEDLEYYHHRAETQLELAQRADNPAAVAAHCAIANAYLERDGAAERRDVDHAIDLRIS